MKSYVFIKALIIAVFMLAACVTASAQQKDEAPDIYEQAEAEADRLQRILDLEDWQVFYVDSTLKHDFPAMMEEYERLRVSKVSNTSLYQDVRDKWMEQIDVTYRKIFTDEQWAAYLKSGATRGQTARAKPKATLCPIS